ncbi:MAG: hypothetical protein ACO1QR_10030 [Chthoniobacteraceae bacterium]
MATMRLYCAILLLAVAFSGCQTPVDLAATSAGDGRWTFPASGIDTVILRAREAKQAQVIVTRLGGEIAVSARPEGGAKGYHPSDPTWRETPAHEMGMHFKARRYGNVLVISSAGEIFYIHHNYFLDRIQIFTPPGIKVRLEARKMDGTQGDGSPDLRR